MKVITGKAKGCRLETPDGLETRPTVARAKEGIFSAICFEIEGRRVLDLFAGSGQMGIEALSRGARFCVFVENNRQVAELVRRNCKAAKLDAGAVVMCQDALSYMATTAERFDLVFLDPPYGANLWVPCLERLSALMADGGTVVCESDRDSVLPETVGTLTADRTYKYGRVAVRLYRKKG